MADSKKYDGSQWEHSLRKLTTATEAIENPLYSDGTAITSYTIKGNTVQSGTPTPSNPVEVQGVGNKTANLCNGVLEQGTLSESSATGSTYEQTKSSSTQSNRVRTAQIVTCGGEVTISCDFTKYQLYLLYYDANGLYTGQHSSNWNSSAVTTNQQYIGIAIRRLNNADLSPNETDIKLMVNTGSTALPYEPFGYKIPISNGTALTPVYLSAPLLAKETAVDILTSDGTVSYNLRKYVLTGNETVEVLSSGQAPIRISGIYFQRPAYDACTWLCTHYPCVPNNASWGSYDYCLTVSTQDSDSQIRIRDIDRNSGTAADFKAFLAAQYAAGTPVTIWIKSQTRTETVTAPSIPTTEGANSITVDTTVQPSEFTATWTGWHDATVKEKSENLFDKDNVERYEYGLGENNTVGFANHAAMFCFEAEPNTNYSAKVYGTANTFLRLYRSDNALIKPERQEIEYDSMVEQSSTQYPEVTINSGNCQYIWLQVSGSWYDTYGGDTIILNTGSTALPYEPYWK